MIRIAAPQIGERERDAVMQVLESGQLTGGPFTRRLEQAFARDVAGTAEAVAVSSGTAALHLALLAHGIGPGDEVITTAFSFQATANMVLATGASPVFVDTFEDGNIDASRIEAAITPRTKAVLPVHLYGRLCEMAPICDITARHGLALIEDAAQAHGAARVQEATASGRAGSFGTGCFSLYATKNLTAGEGGMITTNDRELAERLRRLRSHGEAQRYDSLEVGYNYRITEIGAALALSGLESLAEGDARRRSNAAYLSANLHGVQTPSMPAEPAEHVWHQYTVRVAQDRDALQRHLTERGIQSAVYYPAPLPSQTLYRELGYNATAYPVASRLAQEVLSLPVHPALSDGDLREIVEAVNEWTAQHAPGGAART